MSVIAGVSVLGACAVSSPAQVQFSQADLSCVDDSQRCIAARKRGLSALLADQNRSWLSERPTAAQYAAGVRLFAFRKTKGALTCDELKAAAAEAKSAPRVLRSGAGRGLTPAQVSRGAMLGTETARDLRRERRKRCR